LGKSRNEVDGYKNLKSSCSDQTRKAVSKIVWTSSISQGIKGLFSTGFAKAFTYCLRKLFKMYGSLIKRN